MNALKYKYQQGIQELIQDGMPASEITPYYQTIRRYNHKKLWRMIGIPICVISIIFVFVLTSINILKESLLEIWNKHQRQMSAVELNAILGRGICFSKIEKAHRILVTGMSPSFRQGDPAQENFVCEYEYQGRRGRPLFPGFRQTFPGSVQTGSGVHGFAEFPGNGSEYRVEVLQRPERV